jgi:hypothetical protein
LLVRIIFWDYLIEYDVSKAVPIHSRFRASLYPCPETPQERKEMASGVNTRIDDLQMVHRGRREFVFVNSTIEYHSSSLNY